MNKVTILGNLTRDVEFTTTTSGVSVARFTLAVKRRFKNESGEYESDFINCVAWRNTAEILNKYTKKGNKIAVIGNIQTRSYDAQDGTKRYVTEVIAEEIELLTPKTDGENEKVEDVKAEPIDDGDLPF